MDFRILEWISGFQNGFLDFRLDFWISQWISGFHSGFLDFSLDFWISGFQFGFLPTVYEISFVTDPSVYAYVVTLRVAVLAVGIRMRYLAISGEDSSTYLLVCDKSCFVHSKSVHVLLAQARPAMINHHTSIEHEQTNKKNGRGLGTRLNQKCVTVKQKVRKVLASYLLSA